MCRLRLMKSQDEEQWLSKFFPDSRREADFSDLRGFLYLTCIYQNTDREYMKLAIFD